MVTVEVLKKRLKDHLPSADIEAVDLTGGGDHWQVAIAATEFRDKSMVEQHQMVYAALGELMKADIHALALNTSEKSS